MNYLLHHKQAYNLTYKELSEATNISTNKLNRLANCPSQKEFEHLCKMADLLTLKEYFNNNHKTTYIMKKLNFELQIDNVTYMPERYKAVLMLNGGMSKALPHDSETSIETFKGESILTARLYGADIKIK